LYSKDHKSGFSSDSHGTSILNKLGMLPETRTVWILPASPPGQLVFEFKATRKVISLPGFPDLIF
jgi:hypothetical protein